MKSLTIVFDHKRPDIAEKILSLCTRLQGLKFIHLQHLNYTKQSLKYATELISSSRNSLEYFSISSVNFEGKYGGQTHKTTISGFLDALKSCGDQLK